MLEPETILFLVICYVIYLGVNKFWKDNQLRDDAELIREQKQKVCAICF